MILSWNKHCLNMPLCCFGKRKSALPQRHRLRDDGPDHALPPHAHLRPLRQLYSRLLSGTRHSDETSKIHAASTFKGHVLRDTFWRLVKFLGEIRDRLVLGNKFIVTIEIFTMNLPY